MSWVEPVHVVPALVNDGVMTMVPEIGAFVLFVPLKGRIFPLPDTPRLMAELELVHAKEVPATGPLKVTALVLALLQTTWSEGFVNEGIGLTVMIKDCGVPTQATPALRYEGAAVIVPDIGPFVVLVDAKEGTVVLPEAPRLIAALLFVQANEVPATLNVLENVTAVVDEPTQTV